MGAFSRTKSVDLPEKVAHSVRIARENAVYLESAAQFHGNGRPRPRGGQARWRPSIRRPRFRRGRQRQEREGLARARPQEDGTEADEEMRRLWLEILYALHIRRRPVWKLGDLIVATLKAHPELIARNNAVYKRLVTKG